MLTDTQKKEAIETTEAITKLEAELVKHAADRTLAAQYERELDRAVGQ